MTDMDPKDSVQKEQFGKSEDTKEKEPQNSQEDNKTDTATAPEGISEMSDKDLTDQNEDVREDNPADNKEAEVDVSDKVVEEDKDNVPEDEKENTAEPIANTDGVKSSSTEEPADQESSVDKPISTEETTAAEKPTVTEEPAVAEEPAIAEKPTATEEPAVAEEPAIAEEPTVAKEPAITEEPTVAEEPTASEEADESIEKRYPEAIDYSTKNKEELLDLLKVYLSEYPIENIKKQVDLIKSFFYKLHNTEIEEKHARFIEEGGAEQDFKVEESPVEITMKELLNEYRERRNEFNKQLESSKEDNLKAKYDIIDSIKELINSQESLNKTFQDFRDLQDKWREIGPVPQSNVKDLWEKYHYHVEAFYDYIKINKELRDLDFKKNLEAKIALCEKAEELLLEQSVVEAFKQLQVLHDQWREIGPVPSDKRSELWERFKESTSKINHKHQEYFVKLKEEQKKNLQEKTALCEKAEELASFEPANAKEWETKSKELIELQKVWKTIGFAPKKYNTKIYDRFRAACDTFFNKKRDFFAQNREEQENNLQLKTELCIQAEALADSTDWKKTTDELIKLQKRWKTIGPVPIKHSDKIWKRFRAACDKFFNNKSEHFANIDDTYKDNLKLKEELIKEIENFIPGDDDSKSLNKLKDFQRKWSEIGFVPIKQKDSIQEKYRAAINEKFDALKVDEERKSLLKYRNKVEGMATKPNGDRRISMERDKCYNKIKQLENDIALWENNIGFFSNSKNAESMITDVERKIKEAKARMESLKEKLNLLDEYDK